MMLFRTISGRHTVQRIITAKRDASGQLVGYDVSEERFQDGVHRIVDRQTIAPEDIDEYVREWRARGYHSVGTFPRV